MSECIITDVGRGRNGKPRFWCTAHQGNATGKHGVRLDKCEAAYRYVDPNSALLLSAAEYPGGIALWGAVPPVYDTHGEPEEAGVHVHARSILGEDKDIDATFPAVAFNQKWDLFTEKIILVTQETAVSYYLSRFCKHDVATYFCSYCGEPHLDSGYFAVKPHRKHLCHACGRNFQVEVRGVSNPLHYLKKQLSISDADRSPVLPDRKLDIRQADFPGGLEVWASNPAVLWTAEKPEECGIHVHAYDANGRRVHDDTYSEVLIDGFLLDIEEVAYMMAQQSLEHLRGKIATLICSDCSQPIFDRELSAFLPNSKRTCNHCGSAQENKRRPLKVVSNPLFDKLLKLRSLS